MLNSEKSFKKGADGFISRFVFCTPRPLRMSVLNLTDVPKKLFNINHLLLGICILNEKKPTETTHEKKHLIFDENSLILLSTIMDEYNAFADEYQISSCFIRYFKIKNIHF
jgi:hypothetical protein